MGYMFKFVICATWVSVLPALLHTQSSKLHLRQKGMCCSFMRWSLWLLCKENFARRESQWHSISTRWGASTFPLL